MNHNFRVVWNPATGCYTAVQETAKGRSKSSHSSRALTRHVLACAALAAAASAAQAAPPLVVGDVAGSEVTYTAPAGVTTEVGGVLIGRDTGSVGQVTVSGAGTQLNITPEVAGTTPLIVSHEGGGLLQVLDGAKVMSTGSVGTENVVGNHLAYEKSGRLKVDGAGSSFSSNVGMILGNTGAADMFITGGGRVDIESMRAGVADLGTGSVNMAGDGSKLNVRQGVVLGVGNGTSTSIFADSKSNFTAGGSVEVGSAGYGALVARGGGTMSVGDLSAGGFQGGRGYVEMSGSGTHLQNDGNFTMGVSNSVSPAAGPGAAPTAQLLINDGASMTTTGQTVLSADAGTSATASVEGGGSQWSVGQGLTVGQSGQGQLTLRDGAAVHAADVVVGANAGSTGAVAVSSGSVLSANSIRAGAGDASLQVTDGTLRANQDDASFISGFTGSGGVQIAGTATIDTNGHQAGVSASMSDAAGAPGRLVKDGTGTLTYAGAGTWQGGTEIRQGTLQVGNGIADGSLGAGDVLANGTLQFNQASPSTTFGNNVSGTGEVVQVGSGTLVLAGTNTQQGGTRVMNGVVQVASGTALGAADSTLTLDGGALRAGSHLEAGDAVTQAVHIGAAGGTLDHRGFRMDVMSPLEGPGGLTVVNTDTVAGALGRVALTQAGTYQGGTHISSTGPSGAALLVMADKALGTGPVTLSGNGSHLTFYGDGVTAGSLDITNGVTAGDMNNVVSFQNGANAANATLRNAPDPTRANPNIIDFTDRSGAGQASISNAGGVVAFRAGSSAQFATITNTQAGYTVLHDNATGGKAQVTNSGMAGLVLLQQSDAGQMQVTNNDGGLLVISDAAQAGGATVTNNAGGIVDVSSSFSQIAAAPAPGTGIGSLSGAGDVYLGGRSLTLGALGRDDAISGAIRDGSFIDPAAGGTGGSLVKVGAGTLTVSGQNSYTGATQVTQGTLKAGAVNTFSPGSAITVASGATLDLAGHDQRVAGLANAGTVRLSGADGMAGTRLTLTGPVQGNGGTVYMGTRLGNDASPTDQLVLDGARAVASGSTSVVIENRAGLGALTTGAGIPVVVVQNGAAAPEGTFALGNAGGHVDAGAYEYRMSEAAGTRYLRSTTTAGPGEPEPPVNPKPPVDPEPPVSPKPPVEPQPTYRSEVALHAALPQLVRQGDLAMLSNYHRRIGLPDELGRLGWFRLVGGNMDVRQNGPAAAHVDADYAGFQSGVDLLVQPDWKAGVFFGLQDMQGDVDGNASGTHRDVGFVKKESRYIGAYATWARDGYYVDGVLQSGRHHLGTAAPLSRTHGDAKSITASIEVGKAYDAGGDVKVEPQAQLIYNRARFEDVEIPAATVRQDAQSQVIGRLGVKVHTRVQTAAGELQPYGRVNLWHGFGGTDSTTFLNSAAVTSLASSSGFTTVELAGGFNLKVSPIASVYGELGTAFAAGGGTKVKSSVSGSVGLKFSF